MCAWLRINISLIRKISLLLKKIEKEIGEKYGWRRLKGRGARGGARGGREGREERVYSL